MKFKFFILTFSILITGEATNCQSKFLTKLFTVSYDTNYISTYVTDYTARIFASVKYGNMGYNDNLVGKSLEYRPNNKLLLGIGVNHGFLGVNIGINFPFINQDNATYGETRYYDFTLRIFTPRFNTTIYLQNYRGFYLRNTKDMIAGWQPGDPYYFREDLRSFTAGIEVAYIFNNSKFSYRAAILQNEWQKKSAGSFLVGGSLFYNANIGDSSIIPQDLYYSLFYNGMKFNRSNNFTLGPTIGYAYTLVVKKHFFLLGSINGSGTVGFTELLLVKNEDKVKSGLVFGFRSEILISTGYNSDRWYFGFSFINMSISTQAPISDRTISYSTGIYRINLVRRFATKKPIRLLNPLIRN